VRASTKPERVLRAKFDAAQTTPDNRRHWAYTDSLAADAAADASVRSVLRDRGRYEQFNNPYTDGMLRTLVSDLIGNGPRLQMLTDDDPLDSFIENEFSDWCEAIGLPEKLRIMVENEIAAGECFGVFTTNRRLSTPVKLDIAVIEADQVSTPYIWVLPDGRRVDGIVLDAYGNPSEYHILKQHPGDTQYMGTAPMEYDTVRAEDVLHWFRPRRPGQHRGIPRITSSLPIFAERRDFRKSVLAAARVAAEMGAVLLESKTAANSEDESGYDEDENAGDTLEIDRGMMTFLPKGYEGKQLDPKQPGDNYAEFDNKLIDETARPLGIPSNIARGNSSEYNYASGRLDYQSYDRSLDVDHGDLERKILNRALLRWLSEAMSIPGYLPGRVRYRFAKRVPHTWLWRGRGHVDPSKEASAQETRLGTFTTFLEDEWAKDGKDPETQWKKLEKQIRQLKKLGIELPGAAKKPRPTSGDDGDGDEPPARPAVRAGVNGYGRL
jgi:lambda family phage portal protein